MLFRRNTCPKFVLLLILTCPSIYFIGYNFSEDSNAINSYQSDDGNFSWDSVISIKSLKHRNNTHQNNTHTTIRKHKQSEGSEIVLSTAVCAGRLNESLNSIKSMLIFSRALVRLLIFVDDQLRPQLNETLTRWQNITGLHFQFELHRISFPTCHYQYWLNLFGKCAAQRLFFPTLLPHTDALIYVDADTIFLGPVDELWDQFREFNKSQITALAFEDNNVSTCWYPRFAKHPYYGKYGLNTGVMLMNLTRMRQFLWVKFLAPVVSIWRKVIRWGDQDIINIILSDHSSAVFDLDCRYNYRTDQCASETACASAAARGVLLLHGSRRSFHKYSGFHQPAFRAIYEAVAEHQLGSDPSRTLLARLEQFLSEAAPSACGALKQAFLKMPTDTLRAL